MSAASHSHEHAEINTMQKMFNAPAMPDDLREPGEGLVMRSLDASDFDKGYVALLGQVGP